MPSLGRPIGSTGPRPEQTAVVTWKPRHDRVVMLHLAGYKNVEIAALMRMTPERVGQILLDPVAKKLIQRGRNQIMAGLMNDIDSKLVGLAHKSLENLHKTVNANIKVNHPAKRHQDKVGLDLLKMIGYGSSDKKDEAQPALSNETLDRLSRALERSENVQAAAQPVQTQTAEPLAEKAG